MIPLRQLRLVPIPRIWILGKENVHKIQSVLPHHTFTQIAHLDHNDDFMGFILLCASAESILWYQFQY
jgi:hypothetical protein